LAVSEQDGERDEQAADDRRRQVVAAEHRKNTSHAIADEQRQACKRECLDRIELQQHRQ
jgi:hypothetical protein